MNERGRGFCLLIRGPASSIFDLDCPMGALRKEHEDAWHAGLSGGCKGFTMVSALAALLIAASQATPAAVQTEQDARASADWSPTTIERMLIRAQVEALAIEYYYRVDHGNSEGVVELFTPDGFLQIADLPPVAGRDALREYYAARSKTRVTRHLTTNIRLAYIDADHVEMVRDITYFHGEGMDLPPANPSITTYYESVVRGEDGQWRFAERVAKPRFSEQP